MDIFAESRNIVLEAHRRAALLIVNNAECDNASPPNSAVQIGYKPTGMAVDCTDERSEQKSNVKAMKAQRSRL
jgi:hypothetical protein